MVPDISILIASYNGIKDLCQLLDSINDQEPYEYTIETIVRDDGSDDCTEQIILKEYPWVSFLQPGGYPIGFSASNNVMFDKARAKVVCCLNQDTIVKGNFIFEGLEILKKRPDVAAINTNMIMPWVMGIDDFKTTRLEELPCYEYQLSNYGFTMYLKVASIVRETNFLSGGGFFLRKEAINEGDFLFDEEIVAYCEDSELSLRLMESGSKFLYCPAVVLYHNQKVKQTSSLKDILKLYSITKNRFYVMAKIHRNVEFLKKYPLFVVGIILKMKHLGFMNKKKLILAYSAGFILSVAFIFMFPYWVWKSIALSLSKSR